MEAVNGYQEADKSHSKRVSRAYLGEEYSFLSLDCKIFFSRQLNLVVN
jgi:hypothetical protein